MIENSTDGVLLSVIIPINKIRRDLDNLVSIIRLANGLSIELVFVLDTSEDSAYEILTNICQSGNLNNYKILENFKRNPGSSKNTGIPKAFGDWVFFCDSDDLPNFQIISSYLLNVKGDVDVVIGAYEIENLQNRQIIQFDQGKSFLNWESISVAPGLWRWLIRRELLTGITFPELSMGEDQCFIIRLFAKEPRVEFSQEIFYRYRVGVLGSLTSNKKNIDDLEEVIKLEFLCESLSRKYSRIRNQMIIRQIITLILKGNLKLRIRGLIHLVKIMSIIPPREYTNIIKYISLILMNRRII